MRINLNRIEKSLTQDQKRAGLRIRGKGEMITFEWEGNKINYSMPTREFITCCEMDEFHCPYGYIYPHSYITLYGDNGGITIIISNPHFDFIHIKRGKSRIQVDFEFKNPEFEEIEMLVYFHEAMFKKGFEYYKKWYRKKYRNADHMPLELSNLYHLRRCFLNKDLCEEHAINADGVLDLLKVQKQDEEYIGGFDGMLLFDLGYDPTTNIRCGNKESTFLNEQQIIDLNDQLIQMGLPSFLYFDPYLIDKNSDWDRLYGDFLPIKDRNQVIFRNWGDSRWHPCLKDKHYQKEAEEYLSRTINKINVTGIYLDEMGNGNQYRCYNRDHAHKSHFNQIDAEKEFTAYLQNNLDDKKAFWMSEYPPADCYAHLYDVVLSDTRTPLNIYRFLFPEKKFIRIIGCDLPLGDNIIEINKSFFNGEGLWIDGDTSDPIWYPKNTCKVIKEQYKILKKYGKNFSSSDVEALLECGSEYIFCNRFSKDGSTILTFLNMSNEEKIAYIPKIENTIMRNLYHGSLEKKGSDDIIRIKGGDVACILLDNN